MLEKGVVLVHAGTITKIPKTEGLKQQMFISHSPAGSEVKDQRAKTVVSVRACFLVHRGSRFCYVLLWQRQARELSGSVLLGHSLILSVRAPHSCPKYLSKAHLPTPSLLGLAFHPKDFGGDTNI